MSGCNKRPHFTDSIESRFFEHTSKREFYEICKSYARLLIGDDEYIENTPDAIHLHIMREKKTLKENRII